MNSSSPTSLTNASSGAVENQCELVAPQTRQTKVTMAKPPLFALLPIVTIVKVPSGY
jgi:hypothetical protein